MKSDNRNKLIALAATILIHAAIVALMLCVWLLPPALDAQEKAEMMADDSDLMLLGSEYVIAGDVDILSDDATVDNPASSTTVAEAKPADSGHDLADAGPAGEPAPTITSQQPSPSKEPVKPQTDKPGPSKSDNADAKPAAKPTQESSEYDAAFVNFGPKDTSGKPSGNTGSPGGNSDHGASAGTPGHTLKGRTIASWTKPSGNATGTIIINVKVNRQGEVTHASYGSGIGPVASSASARESCIKAARNSRFSVSDDAPAEQTGTITYKFK